MRDFPLVISFRKKKFCKLGKRAPASVHDSAGNIGLQYNTQGSYGWEVAANSTPKPYSLLRKWEHTGDPPKPVPIDLNHTISSNTKIESLASMEYVRIKDEDSHDQRPEHGTTADDVIGEAVCKALRRTYRTMREYANKGWIPPLPSEWHCP